MKKIQMEIGKSQDTKLRNGYRVIGVDTYETRPQVWYADTFDSAQLLADTLVQEIDQEVEIVKYIGCVRRPKPATELLLAEDYSMVGR